jgi:hypothetical protein
MGPAAAAVKRLFQRDGRRTIRRRVDKQLMTRPGGA